MSMDIYEQTMKKLNFYRELEISEKQIEEGKTKDAKASLEALRGKYGL